MNIYQQPLNPICILKKTILKYFAKEYGSEFKVFEGISPVVTTTQAFDNLLIPKDHVTRRKSDTYFVDATHVLRPHTSAHRSTASARVRTRSSLSATATDAMR